MVGVEMTAAGWFWMIGGWVVMVLAIVAGSWLIGRSIRPASPGRATPLDILQERFARGEIDREAYESARQVLR